MQALFTLPNYLTANYFGEKLKGERLVIGNSLSVSFDFSKGEFFTIAPINTSENSLINFDEGGNLYRENVNKGQSIHRVVNQSEEIVKELIVQLVCKSELKIIIEDFNYTSLTPV
jgi:hypothetical protein